MSSRGNYGDGLRMEREQTAAGADRTHKEYKNYRLVGSWAKVSEKKSDDISQCVAESDILKAGPERPLHEDLKAKPTFQGRSQHFGCVHGPFSEESWSHSERSTYERGHSCYGKPDFKSRAVQAHWSQNDALTKLSC